MGGAPPGEPLHKTLAPTRREGGTTHHRARYQTRFPLRKTKCVEATKVTAQRNARTPRKPSRANARTTFKTGAPPRTAIARLQVRI